MNIYIYGNSAFKKDIHQTLEHANIKFKLDENSIIKDILKLEELKEAIEKNPNDIYLIDDEKIIKKKGLSKKIKFLAPKDGIEEEFLLDNGIADLSVDSLKEIPKYILQKYEQEKLHENQNIQDSIINIVDDAYNKDDLGLDDELSLLLSNEQADNDLDKDLEDLDNNLEVSNDFDIDEEKEFPFENELEFDSLSKDEDSNIQIEDVNLDELDSLMDFDEDKAEELSDEEIDSIINFEEDVGLNNVTYDYDDDNLLKEEVKPKTNDEVLGNEDIINEINSIDDFMKEVSIEGEDMANEFSELDALSEEDIMSALDSLDEIKPLDVSRKPQQETVPSSNASIELESSNVNDIAGLISKLLNNKTLEITIKIKD